VVGNIELCHCLNSTTFVLHGYILTLSLRVVREQWAVVAIIEAVVVQMVASGIFGYSSRLGFMYRVRRRCGFHAARNFHLGGVSQNTRRYRLLPVVASLWDDENVEPTGHHEAEHNPEQQEVRNYEPHDVERIIHETFECWVGETEDDGEDGAGEVAEEGSPDCWERPVFTAADNDVEIVSKLVTLSGY
jgi:hypothetical protein